MTKSTKIKAAIGFVAIVIVIVLIVKPRAKSKAKQEEIIVIESGNSGLAGFNELMDLGYSEDEAKQIMNSDSYKSGIKAY